MVRVIDLHCDTITELEEAYRRGEGASLRKNGLRIDLLRMKESRYLCQCFSLFTNLGTLGARGEAPFAHVCGLADFWGRMIRENQDLIGKAVCAEEIAKNDEKGKMSAVMTVEEGAVYEGRLENLYALYRRGVRISTLTWNYKNELGYPNPAKEPGKAWLPDETRGLTDTGIAFVEEMERIGMLIDLSHLNDAGIRDVFAHTRGPVIATHSNARTVCGHLRNLTDETIREIALRGGVAGINFYPAFLSDAAKEGRISDMIRHIRHMKQVGGIECIALGSDFDGFSEDVEFGGCEGIARLAQHMEKEGFTAGEVERICYQNVLRVFSDVFRPDLRA